MEEVEADDVSCPEKTLCLWPTPPLPQAAHPPPTGPEIRAKRGGPCWKHKQVSDSQRSKVDGGTSTSDSLAVAFVALFPHACSVIPEIPVCPACNSLKS